MLWHPEDAKDATQEILIRVVTNLSSFENRSEFNTWVYRLSTNTLINFKKQLQNKKLSFEAYSNYLSQGLSNQIKYTNNEAEQKLLIIEAKVGCSNAMLQCLNAENRLVYIIGEILAFNSKEGAFILDTTPVNFRKRLSRARAKMSSFLNSNCGIINPSNTCRCYKKVDDAIAKKHINPNQLLFAKTNKTEQLIASINTIYKTPEKVLNGIKKIITTANNM